MTRATPPISDLIAELAGTAVSTQRMLDHAHLDALTDLPETAADAVAPAGPDLGWAVVPPRLALREIDVDLVTVLTAERTGEGALGIDLLGRPVHNFLWVRFGVQESETSRIALTIHAAPTSALLE